MIAVADSPTLETTSTVTVTGTPPTPSEIDHAIDLYEAALANVKAADAVAAQLKAKLLTLVESFGQVPAHAAQSKRLAGHHNEATVTWSTSYSVVEERGAELGFYLIDKGYPDLMPRFFLPIVKHKLVDGADDVLKTLTLPNRIREKIAALVGLAVQVKTSEPKLKVKTIQPEKPARAKRTKAGA